MPEQKNNYIHAEYISPEQLTSIEDQEDVYMAAGDIWSLGCIVFLLLSGRAPFEGNNDE